MAFGQERGVDAGAGGAVLQAARREQFDRVAQLAGVAEVRRVEVADAFAEDVGLADGAAEGQRAEYREFVGGVRAVHVFGGVGLGVAVALRLGEGCVVGRAVLGDARQNVVRGAVDDGVDGGDAVGGEVADEGADDGNAPADAGLERERGVVGGGEREQFRPVPRDDLFVGGHDMLAGAQRGFNIGERGLLAAHRLDDDVHAGAVEEGGRIAGCG